MSNIAKRALLVPALLLVLSLAWPFAAVGLASNGIATLLADVAFAVLVAASAWTSRSPSKNLVAAHVRGTAAAIFLFIFATFFGAILDDSHPKLADVLMQPMSVGYYPTGPDVPFMGGAFVWSLSIAALVLLGVTVGLVLRRFRTIAPE